MARRDPVGKIKTSNAIYPILIGLAVVGYMFYKDFNPEVFSVMDFSFKVLGWLFAAFLFMFFRDFGYIIRLRILSNKQLSWIKAFRIIMLWEFTSAITPSAVGGTSIAIVYVHKEGISVGRSSAIVMLTSFFDELYFIFMFPLLLFTVGQSNLFDLNSTTEHTFALGLMSIALIGYGLKFIYTAILSYGLFINPRGLKWMLLKIFKLPFLRRWHRSINNIGTDIILSSRELKQHGFGFWVKSVLATFLSWSSRHLVANAIILAFFGYGDQVLLFARQLVMWIMMLIIPTPGGSGFAEYIFTVFCGDLIPVTPDLQNAAATLTAVVWRLVTYYPYLIIGVVIFPRWVNAHFSKRAFPSKKIHKNEKGR
ncbi:MAG: flippase-like domain-containing protein [Rikenellaceae bacterium]|nr:flippase-like domain-containing protein [Rikenellaceae bacterium]